MQLPLQLTFRDIAPSDSIRTHVERRAEKLDTFFERLTRCHVVVEAPHRRHHHGKRYHVRIDMTVPGGELVIGRNPPDNLKHEDMHAAIDDAFDDAERMLEDYAQRLRGRAKSEQHEAPPRGKVTKVFTYEGFGFLETDDGREIYFHKNSVLDGKFERLAVGMEVRYAEEMGEKGPQASTVAVSGRM